MKKSDRLMADGLRPVPRNCTKCGCAQNVENSFVSSYNRLDMVFRFASWCKKCFAVEARKRPKVCYSEYPTISKHKKEALRLMRKTAGVKDWHNDDGESLLTVDMYD